MSAQANRFVVRNRLGDRVGRWTVIAPAAPKKLSDGRRRACWLCRCDCGAERVLNALVLALGKSLSCGCLRGKHRHTAGGRPSPTYISWASMMDRCHYPKHWAFARYGARGISVCERWRVFEGFLADMGERPKGRTLDRYPNRDGNYEPGNCRWATPSQQSENRANTVWFEIDGVRRTTAQWARATGIRRDVLYHRIRAGWDPRRALTQPVQHHRSAA